MKEILVKLVELGNYIIASVLPLMVQHGENEEARMEDLNNQVDQLYKRLEKVMEARLKRLQELGLTQQSSISNSFLLREALGGSQAKAEPAKTQLVLSDDTTGGDVLEGIGWIRDNYLKDFVQNNIRAIDDSNTILRAELLDKINDTIDLLS